MNENVKKLKTKISSKWHLNKTIIPLTLIGYEMITANCPIQCMHARRIIVKYIICMLFIYIYIFKNISIPETPNWASYI